VCTTASVVDVVLGARLVPEDPERQDRGADRSVLGHDLVEHLRM